MDSSAFSYKGLIEQLEFDGFLHAEAEAAVMRLGNIWADQAVKSAKDYISSNTFTKDELIEQLEYDGFTHEQAVYGVESIH